MNKPADPSANEAEKLAALRALQGNPAASQRELASTLGLSLGKTNFLIKALLEKGQMKVESFRRSDRKLAYLYVLTPSGAVEKARLTRVFLRRKELEYARLQEEIAGLRSEVEQSTL
jgi:EPS-associated MarR family transcriptional regulator